MGSRLMRGLNSSRLIPRPHLAWMSKARGWLRGAWRSARDKERSLSAMAGSVHPCPLLRASPWNISLQERVLEAKAGNPG